MKRIVILFLTIVGLNVSAFCGNNLKNLPTVKDQVAVSGCSYGLSSDDTFTEVFTDSYGRDVDITITIIIVSTGDTTVIIIIASIEYASLGVTYHVDGEYGNGVFNYTITDQYNNVLQLEDCVNTMGEVMDFIENRIVNQ